VDDCYHRHARSYGVRSGGAVAMYLWMFLPFVFTFEGEAAEETGPGMTALVFARRRRAIAARF